MSNVYAPMSGADPKSIASSGSAMEKDDTLGKRILRRAFDVALAVPLFLMSLPLLIVLAIVIRATSKGPALYWSKRVGRNNHIFLMPKLRSMHADAPQVATHLLPCAEEYVTPIGKFLRRSSLDELPQLFSILVGHMSFVGPRPALFNQNDLIAMRTERGIHRLTPGLTGWAQINGRDNLSIPVKVQYEVDYLQHRSLSFDLQILALTLLKVVCREGIEH